MGAVGYASMLPGYIGPANAAQDMRRDFLPAVVSTSGRMHRELLRLLYLLADNKTKLHFRALDEAIDADSEAYCWRAGRPSV